jgi:hypothetical protein
MKVTMNQTDIGQAIIEYLAKRGIDTDLNKIYLYHNQANNGGHLYYAEIKEVVLPPKEGPYR